MILILWGSLLLTVLWLGLPVLWEAAILPALKRIELQ